MSYICRFVKDTLKPQPVPVEDIIDENSDPDQYRSKRMSKSRSSAEKPKSAKISCAEQAIQVPVEKQGSRVKRSFTFQRADNQTNSDLEKEAERLCKMESNLASENRNQSDVKVILSGGNGEVKLRIPNDKTTRNLIKNIVLRKWKKLANVVFSYKDVEPFLRPALASKVSREFKYYCEDTNSILKGTSLEELSAYPNRFVLQEVKVTCPFCNASLVELKFDALFANLSSILSSGMSWPISYSVAGLTEGSEIVRRVRSLFFPRLDPDPSRPYHNYAFASPLSSTLVGPSRKKNKQTNYQ